MGRNPKSIKGEALASKILEIAFRHKSKLLGIKSYSIAQLERDSGIHHSVIARSASYNSKSRVGSRPKIETVKKLAETLGIVTNPELEEAFYNAFSYASPRQLEQVQSYVEREVKEP